MRTIGVDLGGSHVLAAIVDENGTIGERHEIDIVDHDPDAVVRIVADAIAGALADAKNKADIGAVGIGSPGSVDLTTGVVHYSPNFGWHDVALREMIAGKVNRQVFVANDARCATLGEYLHGSGAGTRDFALLTLGTGIGGGFVSNGALALGHASCAGEIGHHQIRRTDGFYCNCGKVGCFEAQASGTGLIRHALSIAPSFPRSTLVSGKPEKLGSKAIRKAAEAGDPHGLAAWNRYVDDLACGLANVIAFINPQTIALGGGVASAGAFMLDAVRPRVEALTTMASRGTTNIVVASLGNDAGAIGGAAMARAGGMHAAAQPAAAESAVSV